MFPTGYKILCDGYVIMACELYESTFVSLNKFGSWDSTIRGHRV